MKTTTDVNLPYGLFDFMKNAGKYQQYEISDISAKIDSRLEFALGYSRQVSDRLNVGARVKFLVGIANIEANIDRDEHPDERRQMVDPISGNIEVLLFHGHQDQGRKRG